MVRQSPASISDADSASYRITVVLVVWRIVLCSAVPAANSSSLPSSALLINGAEARTAGFCRETPAPLSLQVDLNGNGTNLPRSRRRLEGIYARPPGQQVEQSTRNTSKTALIRSRCRLAVKMLVLCYGCGSCCYTQDSQAPTAN